MRALVLNTGLKDHQESATLRNLLKSKFLGPSSELTESETVSSTHQSMFNKLGKWFWYMLSLKITDLEGHSCYSCKRLTITMWTHIVLELSVPNCVKIICIICSAYIHVLVHAEKYSGNVHGTYYRASGKWNWKWEWRERTELFILHLSALFDTFSLNMCIYYF